MEPRGYGPEDDDRRGWRFSAPMHLTGQKQA